MGGTSSSSVANERKVYPTQSVPVNTQAPSTYSPKDHSLINEESLESETLPLNSKNLASLGHVHNVITSLDTGKHETIKIKKEAIRKHGQSAAPSAESNSIDNESIDSKIITARKTAADVPLLKVPTTPSKRLSIGIMESFINSSNLYDPTSDSNNSSAHGSSSETKKQAEKWRQYKFSTRDKNKSLEEVSLNDEHNQTNNGIALLPSRSRRKQEKSRKKSQSNGSNHEKDTPQGALTVAVEGADHDDEDHECECLSNISEITINDNHTILDMTLSTTSTAHKDVHGAVTSSCTLNHMGIASPINGTNTIKTHFEKMDTKPVLFRNSSIKGGQMIKDSAAGDTSVSAIGGGVPPPLARSVSFMANITDPVTAGSGSSGGTGIANTSTGSSGSSCQQPPTPSPSHRKQKYFYKKQFDNGDVYEGEWRPTAVSDNGTGTGTGTGTGRSGNTEPTEVSIDTIHGHGIYTYISGDIYEGTFSDNTYHGHGLLTLSSGDIYEGEFVRNNKAGRGIMTYANGDVYEGEWKNNMKHGFGTLKIKSYTGSSSGSGSGDSDSVSISVNGNSSSSSSGSSEVNISATAGSHISPTATTDTRTRVRSRFTAPAVSRAAVYQGRFKNDVFHGQGKLHCDDTGETYEGEFADNKKNGRGKLTSKDGEVLRDGVWREDEFVTA